MDELVKLVAKKVGIPEAQAKLATETVINFLKQKLPPVIAERLDDVISGGGINDDLVKGLGSLLGGK
jgi:hypothetical protein